MGRSLGAQPGGRPASELVWDGATDDLDRTLQVLRRHLGMEVAFIARFRREDRVLQYVNGEDRVPLTRGMTMSLLEGYCLKVVRGELPGCIPDTSLVPAALEIPATRSVPIGAHLSVPIRLPQGTIYGTLCCFSHVSNPSLGEREMHLMHAFADVIAARIDEVTTADNARRQSRRELRQALASGAPRMVFQPIHWLRDGRIAGMEALARFEQPPVRGPDVWFEMAHEAGLGCEFERQAVANALSAVDIVPAPVFISVNVSPALILSGSLDELLTGVDLRRLVLEITEHALILDYERFAQALAPLRERGARLAVDDAGAGFASMHHILALAPDIIKLDISLTRNIDRDLRRRALARGLIAFAHETGGFITAEGVETEAEAETLRGLGADRAQGYYFNRPMSLDAAAGLCRSQSQ